MSPQAYSAMVARRATKAGPARAEKRFTAENAGAAEKNRGEQEEKNGDMVPHPDATHNSYVFGRGIFAPTGRRQLAGGGAKRSPRYP